jgi:hypothetical protein
MRPLLPGGRTTTYANSSDLAIACCARIRLLRKKGVGVMLVSQKISDFDPAMRSAMNISILFRT